MVHALRVVVLLVTGIIESRHIEISSGKLIYGQAVRMIIQAMQTKELATSTNNDRAGSSLL